MKPSEREVIDYWNDLREREHAALAAPVPPADGARCACIKPGGDPLGNCEICDPPKSLNQEAKDHSPFDNPRDPFASPDRIPPGTGAAEPVAWRWKTVNGFWRYEENNSAFPDDSQPLYTAPPVRENREALITDFSQFQNRGGGDQLVAIVDWFLERLSLRVQPGAGEREPTPDMRIVGGIAWYEAAKTAETFVDCADACWKAMWDAR